MLVVRLGASELSRLGGEVGVLDGAEAEAANWIALGKSAADVDEADAGFRAHIDATPKLAVFIEWLANIQRVRVKHGSNSRRMRVCTSCIKAGKIEKV